MITGFKDKVEKLLRKNYMRNGIGYVPSYSYKLRKYLKSRGFTIEDKFPDHTVDFIYLPKREATKVPEALTKLNVGGIIVLSLGKGEIKEIRKGYE